LTPTDNKSTHEGISEIIFLEKHGVRQMIKLDSMYIYSFMNVAHAICPQFCQNFENATKRTYNLFRI